VLAAEEQRSRGAEEQRSRGAEEQGRILPTTYPLPSTIYHLPPTIYHLLDFGLCCDSLPETQAKQAKI